jgi:hypothetical protein
MMKMRILSANIQIFQSLILITKLMVYVLQLNALTKHIFQLKDKPLNLKKTLRNQ